MLIKLTEVNEQSNPILLSELESGVCQSPTLQVGDIKKYRRMWLRRTHIGKKLTIIAQDLDRQKISVVGIICLWKNPFNDKEWYIEELGVLEGQKQYGIIEGLIMYALDIVQQKEKHEVAFYMEKETDEALKEIGDIMKHIDGIEYNPEISKKIVRYRKIG